MHNVLPRKVRSRITTKSQTSRILDYYEQSVLPVLFERLDRAFPELHWTRDGDGWTGTAAGRNGSAGICTRLQCKHPWGFVDANGHAISWLTHAHGGQSPAPGNLVETIRQLARRAGVDESPLDGRISSEEQIETHRHERQRELLEAFVAYCHVTLCSNVGQRALEYLQRMHGINGHEAHELPIGVYTTPEDVYAHLSGVGFSEDEIRDSRVVRDVRLDGRIIIPWRDQCGHIRKIVAHETGDGLRGLPRQLYRTADETDDAFGLDIALRPTSGGRDHLILIEGILDVLYFHTHGVTNVATFGGAGKVPTVEQWEQLGDRGIRQVTLAFADDEAGWERTLLALDHAYRASNAPQVFAVKRRSFDTARSAATAARICGSGRFRQVIAQRLHGFRYIALALIEQHKPTTRWTDPELVGLLNDAINFDARVYKPRRAWELDRFFWGPILDEIGANWETIRKLLRRPIDETVRVARPTVIESQPARTIAAPPPPPAAPPVVEYRREPRPILAKAVQISPEPPAEPLPVDVEELAYKIWNDRGCPDGKHDECWFQAVETIRRRQAAGERIYAKSA